MASEARPLLRIGHSPDPDDAFMWWPLFDESGPALDTGRFRYAPVRDDIESLNRRAQAGELEITALSCAAYPGVRRRYALTACGASLGDGFGPRLVAREPGIGLDDLAGEQVAIPGRHTSAWAALRLAMGARPVRAVEVPFDRIIEHVAAGSSRAGIVIHEGQLTFAEAGLHLVEDLGRWWAAAEGLPLPLGVNAIRRDLEATHGPGTLREVTALLRASVAHAMAERPASIAYARRFARGLSDEDTGRFVDMYVNAWSLEFGPLGRAAVARFLGRLHRAGFGADPGALDFVEPAAAPL
jgi:1,4-dihydroxy-6-naphthoate synthase